MSVEKMEKYKEYKKHRKEILRKQKMKERIYAAIGIVACVLVIGLIGFFVYKDVKPENTKDYKTLIDWDKYLPKNNTSTEGSAAETESSEGETVDSDQDSSSASDTATDSGNDTGSDASTEGSNASTEE